MVAEEDLAEGTVLGILLPQLAVEVRALVAAWDLPTQALLLLHGLQGPHGSCGAVLQPTGIDGGKCETQEQQAELAGLPERELSPGVLWKQDAEVDEGTAHRDVKVEWEEFALHETEGMSWKASEKQEA